MSVKLKQTKPSETQSFHQERIFLWVGSWALFALNPSYSYWVWIKETRLTWKGRILHRPPRTILVPPCCWQLAEDACRVLGFTPGTKVKLWDRKRVQLYFILSFCLPSSSSCLVYLYSSLTGLMWPYMGKYQPADYVKGRLRTLMGALLGLPNVGHIAMLQGVPESFLLSWLKTAHEVQTSSDNDLLDHLIICPGLDRIIHAVFLCTLSSSSAFTTKPCIPLHGLEPHNSHDKGPTHHSANEPIDFKKALKQSQQSIWHGMLPDAKTIRALCNWIPVN